MPMRIHHDLASVECTSGLHLAVGIFDGVHLGHQAVVESAVRVARTRGGESGVLPFSPHPSRLFRPEDPTLLIQPPDHKALVLESLGLDILLWMPFTRDFAQLPAADFVPLLKRHIPQLRSLHVGENFRFGRGRVGDIDLMVDTARPLGVHVVSIQRLRLDGEAISSTRIREALRAGDMPAVNNRLGYPYFSIGKVTPGRKLGRQLGFPTLNIPWEPECSPPYGVYAVTIRRRDASPSHRGVANYGVRPTVESNGRALLEVHVLEEQDLGAGDEVLVEWRHFIRHERRFPDIEALKLQIAQDRETALRLFGNASR